MASPPPDAVRYELKLVCQQSAHARVRMALRLHPAALSTLYPRRMVQSVYFDSPFGRAVQENLSGASRRGKLRFRWYGEDSTSVAGVLEHKFRSNTLGWKHIAPVEGRVRVEGNRPRSFVREVERGLARDSDVRFHLRQGLEPVQWIRYRREYLQTADGRVRVTLDRDLAAFDQRMRPTLSSFGATPTPRLLIIEVKCSVDAYEEARDITSRLPIPVDRCSKFVLASDPVHGPQASIFSD